MGEDKVYLEVLWVLGLLLVLLLALGTGKLFGSIEKQLRKIHQDMEELIRRMKGEK